MKVLGDSSVWIEYFNARCEVFKRLLVEKRILTHPAVIGELSCGNIKNRNRVLGDLKILPKATRADDSEVLELIETQHLYGKGLSYEDAQLLASALLSDCKLFSRDRAVNAAARELGIAFAPRP